MEVGVYQINENVALRRQCYFHLVDATDGITAKTGQGGGQPKISINGASAISTVDTLHEVDSTNAPGLYYITLDQNAEIGTYGFIIVRFKNVSVAEFQIICQITADSPYDRHTGPGLALPSGLGKGIGSGGFSKKDMSEFAQILWGYLLDKEGKRSAGRVLLDKSEFDPETDKLDIQLDQQLIDRLETLQASLNKIDIKDYTSNIETISRCVQEIEVIVKALPTSDSDTTIRDSIVGAMNVIVGRIKEGMVTTTELTTFREELSIFKDNVVNLNDAMQALEKISTTLDDIDERVAQLDVNAESVQNKIDKELDIVKTVNGVRDVEMQAQIADLKKHVTETVKKLGLILVKRK